MKINIKNLKIELNNLNRIVEDYEEIYLNLYNVFSSSSFFWNDINSKKFYNDISIEKLKIKKTIDEFTNLIELYNYIIKQYEKIGKNIYYDLSNRYEVLKNIKEYIEKLKSIISKYNNLDIKYCPEVANYINKEKIQLKDSLKLINNIYINVNKFYKKIEEIEKEVGLRCSKFNIEFIKENNVNDYI